MNYEKRISEINQEIENAKMRKFKAEARMEQLIQQRQQLEEQLAKLNLTPDELPGEIERLRQEMDQLIQKVESMLPREGDSHGR